MDGDAILASVLGCQRAPTEKELRVVVDSDGWTVAHALSSRKMNGKPIIESSFTGWEMTDNAGKTVIEVAIENKNLPLDFEDFEKKLPSGQTVAHCCFAHDYFHSNLIKRLSDKHFLSLKNADGETISKAHSEATKRRFKALLPPCDI